MIIEGKIAAAIVTYNRLDFLKKVLAAIKGQSRKPDAIIVVNNSSTDGTEEWLGTQEGIDVITQANVGSSGGQYTGIKTAYEKGYDWIWLMDDDVIPDENALEVLSSDDDERLVRTTFRRAVDGNPYFNDTIEFNFSNPLHSTWKKILRNNETGSERIEADGITFEGPLFHRSLVKKAGLPEHKFFIYGDDTDYFIRAKRAGFRIMIFRDAGMQRLLPVPEKVRFDWKSYYMIRNIIAIDVLHAPFHVRIIRPFRYLVVWLLRSRSFNDIKTTFRAFFDGFFYKRGPLNR